MKDSGLRVLFDACRARKRGPDAIAKRQRERLAEMVTFARGHSPYYREIYHDLPERVDDPTLLPPTNKKALMAYFDDWVTDREVTLEKTFAFVEDPDLIGERFLGKYTVATTSGTTGSRGVFVLDNRNMAVSGALVFRMLSAWLDLVDIIRILASGGRLAMVIATDGHFASTVAATRLRGRRRERIQVFPVHTLLPETIARLTRFRPAILAPYASMGTLLAREQEAGRLDIDPVLVVLSAEGVPKGEHDRIAKAFGAKVRQSYAATECSFLSYSCEHDWLHVNSDWAILEPVDADFRPVPPGKQSHTVLVSNLANRVQPILRYDLGDSVFERPDPCPCGNPLPAIRVQGRVADVLVFPAVGGEQVSIGSMAFATRLDAVPGIELYQIVQTAPTRLRVRLQPATGADPDHVWQAVDAEVTRLLSEHKLDQVTLECAEELPQPSAAGKYRRVIPLG